MLIALAVAVCAAGTVAAQRNRGFGGNFFFREVNPPYDGAFQFCRIMFRQNPNGDGNGWSVDYPRADINLMYRLSELTSTSVSRDSRGDYQHLLFQLKDPELYKCPFVMATEVGAFYMDDEDAKQLRDYLLKGGFLWGDDFWGEYAWTVWEHEIAKAMPEYRFVDIPLSHEFFHMLYVVNEVPQIPSINSW